MIHPHWGEEAPCGLDAGSAIVATLVRQVVGQLNRSFDYSGKTANELETLDFIGMFDAPLGAAAKLMAYAKVDDTSLKIQDRARSYLHANCAGCHRPPSGPLGGHPDFRYATRFGLSFVCNGAPQLGTAGGPAGARLVLAGDPTRSVVSLRMHALGAGQMPPLARSTVDTAGVQILDQ